MQSISRVPVRRASRQWGAFPSSDPERRSSPSHPFVWHWCHCVGRRLTRRGSTTHPTDQSVPRVNQPPVPPPLQGQPAVASPVGVSLPPVSLAQTVQRFPSATPRTSLGIPQTP